MKTQETRWWLKIIIVLFIPLLFFGLLEGLLRISNYGNDLSLFISHPDFPEYRIINPQVGMRYYVSEQFKPEVSNDVFSKEKTPNSLRIFILGGSSAAGYPYLHNGAFSRILRSMLNDALPGTKIEMINVAMTAVNSFTLLDLFPEIIASEPDAILIYSGHNEFYGALGGGSTQSIGSSRLVINTFLQLMHIRSFQLIRNLLQPGSKQKSGTLMKRMVEKQIIPLQSSIYENAKYHFGENMREMAHLAKEANVPLAIGNLVSNLKYQPPFVSVMSDDPQVTTNLKTKLRSIRNRISSKEYAALETELIELIAAYPQVADLQYLMANTKYDLQKFDQAKTFYTKAKDLDGLRFRATEEFNETIHKVCESSDAFHVDVKQYFESASPSGIVGNELILEHLHPNLQGYYLIAAAFFETCFSGQPFIHRPLKLSPGFKLNIDDHLLTTRLDSLLGAFRLRILLNDWPFKDKKLAVKFNPADQLEKITLQLLENNLTWEKAHYEASQYYLKNGDKNGAIREFRALISETPHNASPYIFLARLLIETGSYEMAKQELIRVNNLRLGAKEEFTVNKYLGSIYVQQGKPQGGIPYLEKALKVNGNDPQLIFNLTGAHIVAGNLERAGELLEKYRELNPNPGAVKYLSDLLDKQKIRKN